MKETQRPFSDRQSRLLAIREAKEARETRYGSLSEQRKALDADTADLRRVMSRTAERGRSMLRDCVGGESESGGSLSPEELQPWAMQAHRSSLLSASTRSVLLLESQPTGSLSAAAPLAPLAPLAPTFNDIELSKMLQDLRLAAANAQQLLAVERQQACDAATLAEIDQLGRSLHTRVLQVQRPAVYGGPRSPQPLEGFNGPTLATQTIAMGDFHHAPFPTIPTIPHPLTDLSHPSPLPVTPPRLPSRATEPLTLKAGGSPATEPLELRIPATRMVGLPSSALEPSGAAPRSQQSPHSSVATGLRIAGGSPPDAPGPRMAGPPSTAPPSEGCLVQEVLPRAANTKTLPPIVFNRQGQITRPVDLSDDEGEIDERDDDEAARALYLAPSSGDFGLFIPTPRGEVPRIFQRIAAPSFWGSAGHWSHRSCPQRNYSTDLEARAARIDSTPKILVVNNHLSQAGHSAACDEESICQSEQLAPQNDQTPSSSSGEAEAESDPFGILPTALTLRGTTCNF